MIPGHLQPKGMTSQSDDLPELTDQEVAHAIMQEKKRRAARIGCSPDSITISDDYHAKIIIMARERKRSDLITKEYWNKVDQGRKVVKYTALEVFNRFKETASQISGKEFVIDADNKLLITKLAYYFAGDPLAKKYGLDLNKGLLMLGGVGVGKTLIMKAFSLNQHASYRVVRSRDISYDFADKGFGVVKLHSEIASIAVNIHGQSESGICIDDLGTDEERKHYGDKANALTEIILNRYDLNRHNLTHITTNLNAKMIEQVYGTRVRSRMREMFNQITFDINATDRRK